MMATEMAVSYAAHHPNMTAVNFGHHGYPRHHHHQHHHHHQMSGYDYYTPQRNYQDQVLSRHGEVQDDYDEEDEDVEDDDDGEDSDNESLYTSADMDSELASEDLPDPEPNVAEQLLEFAEAVNRDIQKYFGRKKGSHEPESLGTVYEDRFASGKSGRELYYADLLRVAQSGDAAEPYTSGRGRRGVDSSSSPRMSTSPTDNIDPSNSCTKGLGPLKELFDFALGGCVDETRIEHHHQGNSEEQRWQPRHQEPTGKSFRAIPWRKRSLPTSFFVEPGAKGLSSRKCVSSSVSFGSHVAMVTEQDTPDFSDLVANFTPEYDTHIAVTAVTH